MGSRIAAFAIVALGTVAALAFAHDRPTSKHTYNHHVRPVFAKHCAQCHETGGIAPMSLMKYGDASPWAAAIRSEVLDRKMPPWQPEEGIGEFHGSRYLSTKEIEAIIDWATGGTPEGDRIQVEPIPPPKQSWTRGTPNVVFQAPEVTLSPDVMEITKCMLIAVEQRNMVLRAIEFQPGNVEIAHGAILTTSPACDHKSMPLATWLPGRQPEPSPDGFAWTVPWGRQIYIGIHYRKTWRHDGKTLRDQSRVALYYADPLASAIQSKRVEGTYQAEEDMRLISVYVDGPERVEVNGKPILQIERFDPAWNGKYVFREPVAVAKGARITGTAWLEYVN